MGKTKGGKKGGKRGPRKGKAAGRRTRNVAEYASLEQRTMSVSGGFTTNNLYSLMNTSLDQFKRASLLHRDTSIIVSSISRLVLSLRLTPIKPWEVVLRRSRQSPTFTT